MANRLSNLQVEFVSLVDRAAVRDPKNPTEPQRFLMRKSEVPVWKSQAAGEDHTTTPEGDSMNPEELAAALAKAEQERDEALEAAKTAKAEADAATEKATELEKATAKSADEPEADEIDKSDLPEPVRKALAKAEEAEKVAKAERDAANERIAKAEEIAKEEREIRVTREFVAKADEYRALPFKATEFGPVLKAASEKLTAEEYAAIEGVLKAADEQIASGELFKEHGRSGEPSSDTADSAILAKAAEIRKADGSLSEFDAFERARRENPELARQHAASFR